MQPVQTQKLLSLQEAASVLTVSVDTLLLWNTYNILKPTITLEGQIGYTKHQLDQFLVIRQSMQQAGLNQPPALSTAPAQSGSLPLQPTAQTFPEVAQLTKSPPTTTTVTLSKEEKHIKTPGILTSLPPITFLFGAIFILMAATIVPVYGTQTSTMKLSGKGVAMLPIQLKNGTLKKDLNNEGDNISKEKIVAPALYAASPKKRFAFGNKGPYVTPSQRRLGEKDSGISIDYAETGSSYAQSAPNDADSNAAIDETGHIKGNAKADTLTSIASGIDQMVKSDSFKQVNTDMTNQVILFTAGALALFFILRKQFAYSVKKAPIIHIPPQPMQIHTASAAIAQKVLEVRQKTDGTVVLLFQGKEHKISKPELNSESDKFIEHLMVLTQPDVKEIEFDMLASDAIRFVTPLSRLVTRLGFVGIKRDLFFPRTSKSTVLFRRYLTDQDLLNMQLTPDQIFNDFSQASN